MPTVSMVTKYFSSAAEAGAVSPMAKRPVAKTLVATNFFMSGMSSTVVERGLLSALGNEACGR
jgi:hypothetical protein